jgi:hypothetical protein
VKVVDSRTFNVSTTIAVAEVTVVPGGIRELHVSGCVSPQEGDGAQLNFVL